MARLNFEYNQFSGTIPSEFSPSVSSLEHLQLSNNTLTGDIGETLFRLAGLRTIWLDSNNFGGFFPEFPPDLGFEDLESFRVDNNKIFGSISFSSVANLKSMIEFNVGNNFLSGPLNITANTFPQTLKSLLLDDTSFSGTIPSVLFTSYPNLTQIILAGMPNLIGTIPTEIGMAQNLEAFLAGQKVNPSREIEKRNGLEGTIPTEVGLLSQLDVFDVGKSRLTGTLPSEMGQLSSLTLLGLRDNYFTSNIPLEWGNMGNIVIMDLSLNLLSGTLPVTFTKLEKMRQFSINNNNLTGDLGFMCEAFEEGNLTPFDSDCLDRLEDDAKTKMICDCCTRCCNEMECVSV